MSEQDMWGGKQYLGSVNMSKTAGRNTAGDFSTCTDGTTGALWLNSPSKAK